MMRTADHLVDMGPGAGEHGGYVVAEGTAKDVMRVEARSPASFSPARGGSRSRPGARTTTAISRSAAPPSTT